MFIKIRRAILVIWNAEHGTNLDTPQTGKIASWSIQEAEKPVLPLLDYLGLNLVCKVDLQL